MKATDMATSIAEPEIYRLDDQVGFVLRRVTQRHLAIFSNLMPDFTPTQFAALAKLCELGPVSQNELGRQTAMDAATIKGVIDRLRKRGFVTTRPDPGDQRRIQVVPTGDGRTAYLERVTAAQEITARTLEPLSPRERGAFLDLLGRMT